MSSSVVNELLQHSAALRALARDLVGDAHADDVLQETAIAAMTAPPRRTGFAGGWLRAVVRHLASKHHRAERLRRAHERGASRCEAQPADRSVEDADTLRKLTEIVTALPEPYRGTLLARYLRDLSPRDIAAESGTPVRTVKTRLQRGLQLLRERLADRDADWRPMLVAAFGLEHATRTLAAGVLLMQTTAKFALVGAAVLLASVLTWHFATRPPRPAAETNVASPLSNDEAAQRPTEAHRRTRVDPPVDGEVAREDAHAVAVPVDSIVVRAIDAETGAPIERFGLRAPLAPNHNLLAPEIPLLHAGTHADGRLVLPAKEFEQRTFQLEDSDHLYLPSRWFSEIDAVERDGQRVIEVRLPTPIEVELTVVGDNGRAPVAGTKVELVRPWIGSPETTLLTLVQPADRFRAQPGETGQVMKFLGGRAMLLSGGTTDAVGRVMLSAPTNEPLALRLLGPGHRPKVRNQWVVEPGASPVRIVETVAIGAAIQGRVQPMDVLRLLRLELPAPGPQVSEHMLARYATGFRVRHEATGETIPPGQLMFAPVTPLTADGSFAIDGLHPGDWQVFFCYPLRVQQPELDPRLAGQAMTAVIGLGNMEVELPAIVDLHDHELRVLDVDVSTFLPGRLEATLTLDGSPPGDGAVLILPIAELGAPLPILRSTPNLRIDRDHMIVATLPPARYSASWHPDGKVSSYLLQDFDIRSEATTRVDFVIDATPAQLRVVEADGTTPVRGLLLLSRESPGNWAVQVTTDASGQAEFAALPRGTTLRATFQRSLSSAELGRESAGPGSIGERIDLGTFQVTGERDRRQVLKLPPR